MADPKGVILVVEDTPANVIVLIELLHDEGYIIHEARDRQEALDLVGTTAPDHILMDINMPRLNGFEACRRLKANPTTQNIPLVFISAWGELDDKINGFKAGGRRLHHAAISGRRGDRPCAHTHHHRAAAAPDSRA